MEPLMAATGHHRPLPSAPESSIKCGAADHLDSLNTWRPLLQGNKEAISATLEDSTALNCGGKSANRVDLYGKKSTYFAE